MARKIPEDPWFFRRRMERFAWEDVESHYRAQTRPILDRGMGTSPGVLVRVPVDDPAGPGRGNKTGSSWRGKAPAFLEEDEASQKDKVNSNSRRADGGVYRPGVLVHRDGDELSTWDEATAHEQDEFQEGCNDPLEDKLSAALTASRLITEYFSKMGLTVVDPSDPDVDSDDSGRNSDRSSIPRTEYDPICVDFEGGLPPDFPGDDVLYGGCDRENDLLDQYVFGRGNGRDSILVEGDLSEEHAEGPETERVGFQFCQCCGLCHESLRPSTEDQPAASPRIVLVTEETPLLEEDGMDDLHQAPEDRKIILNCSDVGEGTLVPCPILWPM